jgi:S-adenosylmethionine:tRNA ribosyltransferase-isomerase
VGGRRATGGRAEILLVRRRGDGTWDAMLRPGRRLREHMLVDVAPGLKVRVEAGGTPPPASPSEPPGETPAGADNVLRRVRLLSVGTSEEDALERHGHPPLPPYIHREDRPADRERYQTVYAQVPGAVAAPTAGLHFDEALLEECRRAGVAIATVTLHVGAGTFQPVRAVNLSEHRMHAEFLEVSQSTCLAVAACRERGGRVVAVGTTTVRALETVAQKGDLEPFVGETTLFITPGSRFRVVDALVTNFHLPESTLLMLVCAFAGRERVLEAYRHAVAARYRFFSYGDAMFVEPDPLVIAPRRPA